MGASTVPMVVAALALLGTIITPIITGRMNRNSPTTKADAAEKFTRIAAGVAEDYNEMRNELKELKPLLRELIQTLDALIPMCPAPEDDRSYRLRDLIERLRERLY